MYIVQKQTTMRNACVYIVNRHGYLLMLQCRHTRKWMTPGGRIDNYEHPWRCVVREFKEETNTDLPEYRCRLLHKCQWKDTMVYVIMLNYKFPDIFRPTNETVNRRYIHYSKIHSMRNVKHYVKQSFADIDIPSLVWTSRQF